MIVRRLRPVGEPAPLPSLRTRGRSTESLPFTGWDATGFASGTAALSAAMLIASRRHASHQPRVILPAYSCPDVVSAAVFAKVEVVLADTLPDSPWLDPVAVRALVTDDTVAVVYPRFLGLPANDLALRSAVSGSGVLLIEDSAHAFPQTLQIESSADLVVFSFGRGKPLPLRSGGALLQRTGNVDACVTTTAVPDSALSRLVHGLRCAAYDVAVQPNVYWMLTELAGFRVDAIAWRELRSISGLAPMIDELLPAAIERYRARGMHHQQQLASLLQQCSGPYLDIARSASALSSLHDTSSVRNPPRLSRYPLLFQSATDRDRAYREMWARGLGASRLYNGTLAELPDVSRFVASGASQNASDFAKRLLTLPVHSGVQPSDFERMAGLLSSFSRMPDRFAVEQVRT